MIVQKPWGYEYPILENDNIALWYLSINKDQCTSLHAHSNKKTGLLLLNGSVEVSFLTESFILHAPNKVMIRQGLFHRTKALSNNVIVLEVESPKNKNDLIRLDDCYGREGQPYEDETHYINQRVPSLNLLNYTNFGSTTVEHNIFHTPTKLLDKQYKYILILNGGIFHHQYPVLTSGDIVVFSTLERMIKAFTYCTTEVLGVL